VVLILAGITAGSLLSGPAVAHTKGNVTHLVNQHLVNFFYTEAEADGRFINSGEKATDSNLLDGVDSSGFLAASGKAADSHLLDGIDGALYLRTTGKAADSNALDSLDSSAFVQNATVYTRHFSCVGLGWTPESDTPGWKETGTLIYPAATPGLYFSCSATIPDGAVVTRVDYAVKDSDATDNVVSCAMFRVNLLTSIGVDENMANQVSTTGSTGDQLLTDATISNATIDNASFAYLLQCFVEQSGTDSDAGLYGATVAYTISGANGGG
jgi:hypothetical protein